ncbi:MAG: alpha/beta fold hydrolase [Bacteroidota bacterium]|nr:alpha/beta fold hydrolase [Bacteroidota bacterium]
MKATINNCLTRYIDVGSPNAIPIIFIHGFPFSHKMWNFPGGQIDVLSSTNRVIAYDIRGHGESEVGTGHYSIELFVDDLFALMDHLHIPKAIICGLSMGGYIALRAVERNPERILGLVLCDTRSEADGNEAKIRRANGIKFIQTNGMKFYAQDYVKIVFAPSSFESHPESIKLIQSVVERTASTSIFGTLLALAARTDTTSSLPNITCPTLILVGEKDNLTPINASQAMNKVIPGSTIVIIPNAGHISNMENPSEFNKYLVEFVSQFKQEIVTV